MKIKKHVKLGSKNQKTPGIPSLNACMEDKKSAGPHIHVAAILNPFFHHGISLLSNKKLSRLKCFVLVSITLRIIMIEKVKNINKPSNCEMNIYSSPAHELETIYAFQLLNSERL